MPYAIIGGVTSGKIEGTDEAVGEAVVPGLSLIVRVKPRELLGLGISLLWIFSALTAYYIIKPIRSTVLQTLIGVDHKPTALLATTVFVGLFAYGYGQVAPRLPRRTLVTSTFVFFVACLLVFAAFLPATRTAANPSSAVVLVGYLFFVWVSTFNLMVVSQFWSVAGDVWTKEQASRLFGAIGVGGVTGGIMGTMVVSRLAKQLATPQMLFLSAGMLAVCLALAQLFLRLYASPAASAPALSGAAGTSPASPVARVEKAPNPLTLVLRSPYLRLIALMMLVLNIVNSNNEWILDKVLSDQHLDESSLNAFYGGYFLVQNVLTFAIQLFLTARIQRAFGARGALLVEPLVGVVFALAFLVAPALAVIRWHKILENATDYSVQSNTRELLYVPTSPVEKYSAKNLNDTFGQRLGDALAAGCIQLAASVFVPHLGAAGLKVLVGLNLLCAAVWLVAVWTIGRMHAEKMSLKPSSQAGP